MAAGERIGTAAAKLVLERQPDECGQAFPDIAPGTDPEAQALLKQYIEYVRGPINRRIKRCYEFNETQRAGLIDR